MPQFSQMPTLGEFIARAKQLGWSIRTIRAEGIGRIRYLTRPRPGGLPPAIVDLPSMPEDERLRRNTLESLCERADVPREDFGLGGER